MKYTKHAVIGILMVPGLAWGLSFASDTVFLDAQTKAECVAQNGGYIEWAGMSYCTISGKEGVERGMITFQNGTWYKQGIICHSCTVEGGYQVNGTYNDQYEPEVVAQQPEEGEVPVDFTYEPEERGEIIDTPPRVLIPSNDMKPWYIRWFSWLWDWI